MGILDRHIVGDERDDTGVGDPVQNTVIEAVYHRAGAMEQFRIRVTVHRQDQIIPTGVEQKEVPFLNCNSVLLQNLGQNVIIDRDAFVAKLLMGIAIDIKPGNGSNSINPRSRGVIPVAILTTDAFDARDFDPATAAFGPHGAGIAHSSAHLKDVDKDGDTDLLMHFRTRETGIECGETIVTLKGASFAGTSVQGSDSIRTVGCK